MIGFSAMVGWLAFLMIASLIDPVETPSPIPQIRMDRYFDLQNLVPSSEDGLDSWRPWEIRPRIHASPSPDHLTITEQLLLPLVRQEEEFGNEQPDLSIPELSEFYRPDIWGMLISGRDSGWNKSVKVYSGSWGRARAKLELPDPQDYNQPHLAQHWRAEEFVSVKVPQIDSLFLYGQLGGNGNSWVTQQARIVTKTGLGWKWVPLPKTEVIVRGGPMVTYGDLTGPNTYQRSQLAVELLAEMPVWGPWRIEYFGSALPALLPTDRDKISNDLRLVLPVRKDGEFHFGASYRWENTLAPTTSLGDRAQLYIGFELRH